MMTNPSIFRRAYDGVALFALLNVLAAGVLGAFLVSAGAIDLEKLRAIAGVMRGDLPADHRGAAVQDDTTADGETAAGVAHETNAVTAVSAEIVRLEADRVKAELDQRLALNNSILLRVSAERDRFKSEQSAIMQQKARAEERRRDQGFRKQIEIYESLSPKLAVEHLLSLPNSDEAARILLEMDTRKAKGIVEAAKSPEQLTQMKEVLQRLEEVSPDRTEALKSKDD